MRKLLLFPAVFILFFAVISLNAQIRMDENFDYPAGDSLGAHGWTGFSSFVNVITVATPGLTYSGYPLSNIGNSVRMKNNGQDAYKDYNPADSTGNLYCAFMVNIDSAKSAGDYFFAFLPQGNTSFYTARVFAKDTNGSVAFGVSKSTSPIVYTGPNYNYGTTYLLVVKYTFIPNTTTDDEVRLFVFSGAIPGTEPAPTLGPVTQAINDNTLGRVALRQGSITNAATLNIDGIRVFKTWANIVGIKNISSVAESFSLSQNYPNPFNPSTNIKFSIPERGYVSLKVYDMLGREVSNLVNGDFHIGTYEVNFEGTGLSSGIYLYRMNFVSESGKEFTGTKKLTLLK